MVFPKLEIILDKASIGQVAKSIDSTVKFEAEALVARLGNTAVRFLRKMDEGAGHRAMSRLWTVTPVRVDSSGVSCEVYSTAEGKTFYTRSGNPASKRSAKNWPVKGDDLIAYLEYGTRPHHIAPRRKWEIINGRKHPAMLRFRTSGEFQDTVLGDRTQAFLGAGKTQRGVEGYFIRPDGDPEMVWTEGVLHPGFGGFHFLATTRGLIEERLQAEAELAAKNVSVRLG